MSDKPVKDYDKFVVRFPDGLRDKVALMAKANNRSMNSEIIEILRKKVEEHEFRKDFYAKNPDYFTKGLSPWENLKESMNKLIEIVEKEDIQWKKVDSSEDDTKPT